MSIFTFVFIGMSPPPPSPSPVLLPASVHTWPVVTEIQK